MKYAALASVTAMALLGASLQSSIAQPSPPLPGNDAAGHYAQAPEQTPPPGPNDEGPRGPGRGGPPPAHRPPPPPNAARFVFQRGDARMEITCPASDPLQDCVQAASQLMDKLATLRRHGSD